MKLSIYLPASLLRSLSVGKAIMLKRLSIFALVLAGCAVSVTQADATFTYELSGSDDKKTVKQFSIARFFVRIDDPAEPEQYLLFQAGKFFPMYSVDEAKSAYTRLTPAVTPRLGPVSRSRQAAKVNTPIKETPADSDHDDHDASHEESEAGGEAEDSAGNETETVSAEPARSEDSTGIEPETASAEPAAQPGPDVEESTVPTAKPTDSAASPAPSAKPDRRWPTPILKASKKTRSVAGIRCRVVHELLDGEPIIEHCMANSARLSVTDRELITLSRLFAMSRNMGFDWLGIGTRDEEFVAVQSRDLRDNRVLQLTSVSTKPLPAGYLRIPSTYKQIESDAQSDSGSASKVVD